MSAIAPTPTPCETGGFIPLCVPEIGGNAWAYTKDCLDTGWVSSVGAYVDRFEREMAAYVGTRRAVATASGTAALHIALLVAGVAPDDEVLVSTLTFIAPGNAIRYAGAWPVFIDAAPRTWQMAPEHVADFLENHCRWQDGALRNTMTGRRVRALVPVHILGHPVDMDPLLELARRFNLTVIEDATESLGASYRDRPVGHLGDIACFSFNGNKLLTTGGGGMLVTDNEEWARRARHLTTQAKADPIEYIHDEIGYNYRLTNLQAALGCAQLEQIEAFLAAKRRIAETYGDAFADLPGIEPLGEAEGARSAFWLYSVRVDPAKYGSTSRELMHRLGEQNIQTRPLWQPLHLSPAHAASASPSLPVAEELYRDVLSLPCSVGLTPVDQERVIRAIRDLRAPGI